MSQKRWHIVLFTGYNGNNIIILSEKLKKLFGEDDVFCPIVKERRYNGKKRIFYEVDVPLFFGYIFIRTPFDSALESFIESNVAPHFTFLRYSADSEWAYVTNDDIERLKIENKPLIDQEIVLNTAISMGDIVRFKSGPFCNFTGRVLVVFPSKNTAKVITAVFKTETAVEVPINALELL